MKHFLAYCVLAVSAAAFSVPAYSDEPSNGSDLTIWGLKSPDHDFQNEVTIDTHPDSKSSSLSFLREMSHQPVNRLTTADRYHFIHPKGQVEMDSEQVSKLRNRIEGKDQVSIVYVLGFASESGERSVNKELAVDRAKALEKKVQEFVGSHVLVRSYSSPDWVSASGSEGRRSEAWIF